MAQKKRSFEPKPLQDVLREITGQKKLAKGLNELRVQQLWREIAGKNVMQYTQSTHLRGKTLHIKLSSAPLREELSYGKEKILKHMNDALGFEAIQKIVFR